MRRHLLALLFFWWERVFIYFIFYKLLHFCYSSSSSDKMIFTFLLLPQHCILFIHVTPLPRTLPLLSCIQQVSVNMNRWMGNTWWRRIQCKFFLWRLGTIPLPECLVNVIHQIAECHSIHILTKLVNKEPLTIVIVVTDMPGTCFLPIFTQLPLHHVRPKGGMQREETVN